MPKIGFGMEKKILAATEAIEMGVDETQIILSDNVSNTAEEALAIKRIIEENGINKILLITSSFHMPRAKLLFDRQGIDSDAFPVDFRATGRKFTWLSFLPSAGGFALSVRNGTIPCIVIVV